uniref:Uncharacterized protein n=1 Tax=Tanacetum cinerariifolium TaxID=118510 RepID=A0A699RCV7_TANCI|nr:hypothetical protein [Tanacetum cinerariifolium]
MGLGSSVSVVSSTGSCCFTPGGGIGGSLLMKSRWTHLGILSKKFPLAAEPSASRSFGLSALKKVSN